LKSLPATKRSNAIAGPRRDSEFFTDNPNVFDRLAGTVFSINASAKNMHFDRSEEGNTGSS
jgi:hypothetical protein